jgi:hypothetical protein
MTIVYHLISSFDRRLFSRSQGESRVSLDDRGYLYMAVAAAAPAAAGG